MESNTLDVIKSLLTNDLGIVIIAVMSALNIIILSFSEINKQNQDTKIKENSDWKRKSNTIVALIFVILLIIILIKLLKIKSITLIIVIVVLYMYFVATIIYSTTVIKAVSDCNYTARTKKQKEAIQYFSLFICMLFMEGRELLRNVTDFLFNVDMIGELLAIILLTVKIIFVVFFAVINVFYLIENIIFIVKYISSKVSKREKRFSIKGVVNFIVDNEPDIFYNFYLTERILKYIKNKPKRYNILKCIYILDLFICVIYIMRGLLYDVVKSIIFMTYQLGIYVLKFFKIIKNKTQKYFIFKWFKITIIISIMIMYIIIQNIEGISDVTINSFEFIGTALIIPLVLEQIMELKKNKI